MRGKTVIVTGATGGIGKATARGLAKLGARVVLAARDEEKGRAALEEVRGAATGEAPEWLAVDLASQRSIRAAAAEALQRFPRIDVLVNNAGVWPSARRLSPEGLELTFAVNVVAPWLFTRLLAPALRAAAPARVVNVSSSLYRRGKIDWDDLQLERSFSPSGAYSRSKLAVVLLTRALATELAPEVTVNAVHPGVIATDLARDAPAIARFFVKLVFRGPDFGAAPEIRLASASDVAGVTGQFFDRLKQAPLTPAAADDAAVARLRQVVEKLAGAA